MALDNPYSQRLSDQIDYLARLHSVNEESAELGGVCPNALWHGRPRILTMRCHSGMVMMPPL